MTKINVIMNQGTLLPNSEDAVRVMGEVKEGKEFVIDLAPSRNPKHHRLFWAMLGEIVKSGAWEGTAETLNTWLKFKCHHVTVIVVDGKNMIIPKSIAFHKMSQDQFRRYFDRAVYFICKDLLGEAEWEKFRDDLVERLEAPYRDQRR